jgi:exodeoxyribonuclease V beta subunit
MSDRTARAVPRYRRPAVLAEVPLDRHAVIEASAGTGKTHTLEHLYIELLLHGRGPGDDGTPPGVENLLVVTFTERATAELKLRLRRKLVELVQLAGGDGEGDGDGGTRAGGEGGSDADQEPGAFWELGCVDHQRLSRALARFDSATIATIHGFCHRVLGEHAFAARRLFNETQVSERRAFASAFKSVLRDEIAGGRDRALLQRYLARHGVADLEDLLYRCHVLRAELAPPPGSGPAAGSAAAAALLPPPPLELEVARAFLPAVEAGLVRRKREAGQFDFQDMLGLLDQALHGPHGEDLCRALRARYSHALIDEFQDTDEVQWSIFRRLFFERSGPAGGTLHQGLYLIGDPKQAIYAFRGADVNTYLRARREVVATGGRVVPLTLNHRSSPALIGALNAILDGSVPQPLLAGEITYDAPVVAARTDLGAVDISGAELPPLHLFHLVAHGKPPTAALLRRGHALRIAREIQRLLDPRGPLRHGPAGDRRPLTASEIFVLTRTAAEAHEIGAVLREAGIAHAFYRQEGLFTSPEALHLRDVLAAVVEPSRLENRFRAWLTPFFGVALADLGRCRELPDSDPLVSTLNDWHKLAETKNHRSLFSRLLSDSGLLRRLVFLHDAERALTNYTHLCELLLEEATRGQGTLRELLQTFEGLIAEDSPALTPEGDLQRVESEREAVQVMTIHKSKGLEAAVVFIYGGLTRVSQPGSIPVTHVDGKRIAHPGASAGGDDDGGLDAFAHAEERRLLYVALTRAKVRLYLPYIGGQLPGEVPEPGPLKKTYPWTGFRGCLVPLNRRLTELGVRRTLQASCIVEETLCPRLDQSRQLRLVQDLSSWQLLPAPVPVPRPAGDDAGSASAGIEAELVAGPAPLDHARLRWAHAGLVVDSYSSLKRSGADVVLGLAASPTEPVLELEMEAAASPTDAPPVVLDEPGPDEVPGGAESGVFLHEVIEELTPEMMARSGSLDAFRQSPEVQAIFVERARRNQIPPRCLPHAQELVYATLTTAVPLGDTGPVIEGLGHVRRQVREMGFVFPVVPGRGPGAAAVDGDAERGYIKGYIDCIFAHHGRCYLVDWKSDRLPSYEPAALRGYVHERYELQLQLYLLALVKAAGVVDQAGYQRVIGGLLYCFLRGMDVARPGHGVYVWRPGWDEVAAWQEQLAAARAPLARGRW